MPRPSHLMRLALAAAALYLYALACGGVAALDAGLFVLSDNLIGTDRFVSPSRHNR